MTENEVAAQIVDAAFKVHSALGPGLFESVYERVLLYEFRKRGLQVLNQHPVAIDYETVHIEEAFKADLIVENLVIVELKSVEAIAPDPQEAIADLPASERTSPGSPYQFQR